MGRTPDRDRAPQHPADAYGLMASVLPSQYFTTPPPANGTMLHVQGRDKVWTRWAMPDQLALAIATAIDKLPVRVRSEPYVAVAG